MNERRILVIQYGLLEPSRIKELEDRHDLIVLEVPSVDQVRLLGEELMKLVDVPQALEQWEDVTEQCDTDSNRIYYPSPCGRNIYFDTFQRNDFRLRKVQLAEGCLSTRQCWAFKIEKKVSI